MDYRDYLGQSEIAHDTVDARLLADAAAVLDADLKGSPDAPPLWHWTMFGGWVRSADLRPDGGLRGTGFLPPFGHLPRRLAAGGRLRFARPLRVGDRVTRTSRIQSITDKVGRAGPMVLLTIHRTFDVAGEVVLDEEQDVVYMPEAPAGADAPTPAPAAALEPLPARAVVVACKGDALTLFRYSALTSNSHRIHYDLDYATRVEGFPGLVVHGPLQATWLAGLAASLDPSRRLASMRFRNLGPAYHQDELLAAAWRDGDVIQLALRKRSGEPCMSGSATLA
jgi:3-methylfumaryl-CoA hydratase